MNSKRALQSDKLQKIQHSGHHNLHKAMQSNEGTLSKTNHLTRHSPSDLSKHRTSTDNYVEDGVDAHKTAGDPFVERFRIDDHKARPSRMFVAPKPSSGRLRSTRIFGPFLRSLLYSKASHKIKQRVNKKRNKMMQELEQRGSAPIKFRKNWEKLENVSYCIDMTNVLFNLC